MTVGKGKRPRSEPAREVDCRSLYHEPPEEFIVPDQPTKPSDLSAYMAAMGRKGGQISGKRGSRP
jgi:hypothetical protein